VAVKMADRKRMTYFILQAVEGMEMETDKLFGR
jgi:hypothetical protein